MPPIDVNVDTIKATSGGVSSHVSTPDEAK